MIYVDGFVAAVRADRKDDYRAHAARMSGIFFECGALRVVETWGDDVPDGKRTDFRRAVQAEDGEVVLFSWIEWPSKEARDAGWKTLMADPRMQHVPIIAISAFAMLDERKRFLDAGCNDVQPKPLDFGALLESIGRHLKPSP